MTQDNTIQVTQDDSTENYGVYESADGDTIVGTYVANEAAEQVGKFAEVVVGSDKGLTLSKKKDTSNYGVYENQPAISGMYISHDVLDSEESEEGEPIAPDELTLTLNASSEEAFEQAIGDVEEQADELVGDSDDSDDDDEPSAEEQADSLVGGSQDDSDESGDADAETEGDSPSENVEIADDELGL